MKYDFLILRLGHKLEDMQLHYGYNEIRIETELYILIINFNLNKKLSKVNFDIYDQRTLERLIPTMDEFERIRMVIFKNKKKKNVEKEKEEKSSSEKRNFQIT